MSSSDIGPDNRSSSPKEDAFEAALAGPSYAEENTLIDDAESQPWGKGVLGWLTLASANGTLVLGATEATWRPAWLARRRGFRALTVRYKEILGVETSNAIVPVRGSATAIVSISTTAGLVVLLLSNFSSDCVAAKLNRRI
jgi:hypothetical protein